MYAYGNYFVSTHLTNFFVAFVIKRLTVDSISLFGVSNIAYMRDSYYNIYQLCYTVAHDSL